MPDKVYPPARHRERRNTPGDGRYLTCSCFHNRPFLKRDRACGWFVEALRRARDQHAFALWAWCIMPTHFHMLILPRRDEPLVGGILKSIKQSVAQRAVAWVRTHAPEFLPQMIDAQPGGRHTARLWQRNGGYDRNMFTGKHTWDVIHYIHDNPVKDGLVKRAADWPWSSAREFEKRGAGPVSIDWKSIPRP